MFDCECICHADQTKRHCDELSCVPCCTVCQHCEKNIEFGKMVKHYSVEHGIEMSDADREKSRESLLRFKQMMEEAMKLFNLFSIKK